MYYARPSIDLPLGRDFRVGCTCEASFLLQRTRFIPHIRKAAQLAPPRQRLKFLLVVQMNEQHVDSAVIQSVQRFFAASNTTPEDSRSKVAYAAAVLRSIRQDGRLSKNDAAMVPAATAAAACGPAFVVRIAGDATCARVWSHTAHVRAVEKTAAPSADGVDRRTD